MEKHKKNGDWKLLRVKSDNHAVSQVISVLLVVSMVVAMMTVILFWAMPLIEEKRSENEMQTVFYSFEIMDNTVEGLLMEGSDAKRVVGVVCPNDRGDLSFVSSTDNKLVVMYNYDDGYDFNIIGLEDQGVNDPSFDIPSNPFDKATIYFLNPSGDYAYSEDTDFVIPDDYDLGDKENLLISIDTFTATKNLEGNLLIDLYDNTLPNPKDTIPMGRIWVFELGSITYKAHYNFGNQKTVFENGAIMSTGVKDKGIINNPALIITNDKTVALRVIQIHAVGRNSFSGRNTPKVEFDLKNSFKREKPTDYLITTFGSHVSNLKFQIFGDNEQVWLDYFTNMDDFTISVDPNTVSYNIDGINFILDSSFIEVDVGL